MYLMHLDIAYAVETLLHHVVCPAKAQAVKYIFCYLCKTS